MNKKIIEICCGSADDVIEAGKAGADRVELNSGLFLGGITPSVGELRVAKRTGMKILCMVRPRAGGFCYTETEFETMREDARVLLENGADGIVFGFLHEDGSVDEERTAAMLRIVGSAESVFHRAIDVTPDWRAALDALIRLGVTRVLTSGQAPSAHYGMDVIRAMREHAAGRTQILPGAGIRMHNVEEILEKTGCSQLHVSLSKSCEDRSTAGNPAIFFGGALYPPEDRFAMADRDHIGAFVKRVNG